jgi:hypothetical protein
MPYALQAYTSFPSVAKLRAPSANFVTEPIYHRLLIVPVGHMQLFASTETIALIVSPTRR